MFNKDVQATSFAIFFMLALSLVGANGAKADSDLEKLSAIERRMESWKARTDQSPMMDIYTDLSLADSLFFRKNNVAAIREKSDKILRRAVAIAFELVDSKNGFQQDFGGELFYALSLKLTREDVLALEPRMSASKTTHALYQMSMSLHEIMKYQLGFNSIMKQSWTPSSKFDRSSVAMVKTLLGVLTNAVEEHLINQTPAKDLNRNLEITVEDLRRYFVDHYVAESGFFKSELTPRYAALVTVIAGADYRRALNVCISSGSRLVKAKDYLKTIEEAKVIAQNEHCQNLLVPGSLDASLIKEESK